MSEQKNQQDNVEPKRRIVRGSSSKKTQITDYVEAVDGEVLCQSCMRIVTSKINLNDGNCPFCHQDVTIKFASHPLLDNDETDEADIALPC